MRAALFETARQPLIVKEVPDPACPRDGVVVAVEACGVCRSDWHAWNGADPDVTPPHVPGHEFAGVVVEVGSEVRHIKPGQFVIGSFATSDNTCPHCQAGYQSSCVHREWMLRAQAPVLRVPLADGTLVRTPGVPSNDLIPSLLTTSDVLGTGWYAAVAARVSRQA